MPLTFHSWKHTELICSRYTAFNLRTLPWNQTPFYHGKRGIYAAHEAKGYPKALEVFHVCIESPQLAQVECCLLCLLYTLFSLYLQVSFMLWSWFRKLKYLCWYYVGRLVTFAKDSLNTFLLIILLLGHLVIATFTVCKMQLLLRGMGPHWFTP